MQRGQHAQSSALEKDGENRLYDIDCTGIFNLEQRKGIPTKENHSH